MAKEKRDEEEKEKGSSGMLKNLIMYLGTVVVLTAAAYMLVTKFMPTPVSTAMPRGESVQGGEINKDEELDAEKDETGVLYEFGDVIVNPAGTEGTRFLKVTLYLELRKGDYQKILEKYKPKLQDVALQIFSSKTVEELEDVSRRGDLRKEIVDGMNMALGKRAILRVFFTEFVIQ